MGRGASAARKVWDHVGHPHRRGAGLRVVLALVVLLVSALPLRGDVVSPTEEAVFTAINRWPDWIGWILFPIMQLGTFVAIVAASLAARFFFKRPRVAVDLAAGGAATWILTRIVKAAVARGRPGELLTDVILRGPAARGYGYISGHTSVAFALATVAAAYLGPRGKLVVFVLAALVGIARIFVGVHLPLDVLGGAGMGWAVGSLVHFLVTPELVRDEENADPPG